MKNIAVLEDNTRTAEIIGYAATAEQAADVYMTYLSGGMDPEDFATIKAPVFVRRWPGDTAAGDQYAWEPMF
jgi:hypothetical protein